MNDLLNRTAWVGSCGVLLSTPVLIAVGCVASTELGTSDDNPNHGPYAAALPTTTVPADHGALDTGTTNPDGSRAAIACATCHEGLGGRVSLASTHPNGTPYHSHVALAHGNLKCGSCHVPDRPMLLRLADETELPMSKSMDLCGQCHGPQKRDYDHGAHGGMRGYWDTTKGPRQRNHCASCHHPHGPAYPKVMPVAPPRDRFLTPKKKTRSSIEGRFGSEHGSDHE